MMRQSEISCDRWYLRVFAAIAIVLCGICSIRYLWFDLFGGASVSLWTQLLCMSLTASSITYFIRPRLGHRLLVAITLLVLVVEAPAGPPAAAFFWFAVLALLLLPSVTALVEHTPVSSWVRAGPDL